MSLSAVVFAGMNGLDQEEIRKAVVRIPEVSIRVKEAQKIIDRCFEESFDLHSYIVSPQSSFLHNIRLKSLASAIVQIGLYERYIKFNLKPNFIVGNSNGDSALNVISGQQSFQEMIINNSSLNLEQAGSEVDTSNVTNLVLSGVSLEEYKVVSLDLEEERDLKKINEKQMDFQEIFKDLVCEKDVKRFINIGPSMPLVNESMRNNCFVELQLCDSIEMDPMLNWFWTDSRLTLSRNIS